MIYALDANIISFALKGNTKILDRIDREIINGSTINIPPIVLYEIRRGLLFSNSIRK
jgi:predicted nucleic acid-binding protein